MPAPAIVSTLPRRKGVAGRSRCSSRALSSPDVRLRLGQPGFGRQTLRRRDRLDIDEDVVNSPGQVDRMLRKSGDALESQVFEEKARLPLNVEDLRLQDGDVQPLRQIDQFQEEGAGQALAAILRIEGQPDLR